MARNARELRVDRGAAVDPGVTGVNSRIATDYTFDANGGLVVVKGVNLQTFLYIINQGTGEAIFNPALPELRGVANGRSLQLQLDTSRMSNSDALLIVYEPQHVEDLDRISLENILEELKVQTEILRRITNER